ncbi:hypothetical protein FDA94_15610 [Herbidospora galbida]|uniref:Uncharacterized protein n=1 Tax=Herbidospora galbida TaxID=2575442 RepID=A0A4U3MHX7_9ACTN|nr:hypothetical protein [Herbidospora galbida]TKK87984.1 hypothetical protein FDA94_15610 [Herbidospora galbida]
MSGERVFRAEARVRAVRSRPVALGATMLALLWLVVIGLVAALSLLVLFLLARSHVDGGLR